MTDDKKHYVLQAEAGSYRLTGGIGNLIANTALIATESLRSPTTETIIVPSRGLPIGGVPGPHGPSGDMMHWRTRDSAYDPAKDPGAIVVPSKFKWVLIIVSAITIFAGVAEIVMASMWGTPTGLQQEVFSAMDFVWKAGFGALVGLLGGKAS